MLLLIQKLLCDKYLQGALIKIQSKMRRIHSSTSYLLHQSYKTKKFELFDNSYFFCFGIPNVVEVNGVDSENYKSLWDVFSQYIYECYIRFIITEHEGCRPEGEVIVNLI